MPKFYVQVEEVRVWNLTIEAEDVLEAQDKAIGELQFVKPDYTLAPEIVVCDEVDEVIDDAN